MQDLAPLSANGTWCIRVNGGRQPGPPFMLIHPLQLLIRPSPREREKKWGAVRLAPHFSKHLVPAELGLFTRH